MLALCASPIGAYSYLSMLAPYASHLCYASTIFLDAISLYYPSTLALYASPLR